MASGVSKEIVYAFLREACEDSGESYANVATVAEVYATLRALQNGKFTATTAIGTTLISSTVSGKTFSFSVNAELSPVKIMAAASECCRIHDLVVKRAAENSVTEAADIVKAIKAFRYPKRRQADFSTIAR